MKGGWGKGGQGGALYIRRNGQLGTGVSEWEDFWIRGCFGEFGELYKY